MLLGLVADPKAAAARVRELHTAMEQAQQAHERVLLGQRDLNAKTHETEARLTRDRKDLDASLEAERSQVFKEHQLRRERIEIDEADVVRRIAAVETREKAVAAREREVEQKFVAMRKLVA
jgi:hypothetical protein